jgi:hypothetical protein
MMNQVNTLWHVQEQTTRGWISLDESESEEAARVTYDAAVARNATARLAKSTVQIVSTHFRRKAKPCQH